jgi:hypothetical protein
VATASPTSRPKVPRGKSDAEPSPPASGGADADGSGEAGAHAGGVPAAAAGGPVFRALLRRRRGGLLTWAALGGIAAGAYARLAMGMGMGPPLVMTGLGGFTLVLSAAALWRIVDPLTRAETRAPVDLRAPQRLRELEREKQAVLKAIKEIELDYQMRKISAPDYREMIERYRARALRILGDLAAGDDYRVLIERELKGRLAALARVGAGGGVNAGPAGSAGPAGAAGAPPVAPRPDPVGPSAVSAAPPPVETPTPAEGAEATSFAEAPTVAAGLPGRPASAPPSAAAGTPHGPATPARFLSEEPRPIRCTDCQTVNDLDARFCKRCGKTLLPPASSVPA